MTSEIKGYNCYRVTMLRVDAGIEVEYIVIAPSAVVAIDWAADMLVPQKVMCKQLTLLGTRVIGDPHEMWMEEK